MSTISVTNIADGDAVTAASVNNQINTIVNDYNGSISSSNLASSSVATAAIQAGAVTNAKLNTATGELGGAWNTYTPTWANLTVGNSTNSGRWLQVGKLVFFEVELTLGSTGSVSTNPTFTLPVTSISYSANGHRLGSCIFYHPTGSGVYGDANLNWASTTTAQPKSKSGGYDAGVSSTAPFTWATSDMIICHGFYEAA